MPKHDRWKSKVRSSSGIVYVTDDRYDPWWPDDASPDAKGYYRNRQHGYRWDNGVMVWQERWNLPGDDGVFAWTDWKETGRSNGRVRQPKRKVVPDLTDAEKDAWADLAWIYVSRDSEDGRSYSRQGCTTAYLAGVLPGWDDTITFEPGRTPASTYDDDLFTQAHYDAHGYRCARTRAYALAGMALRHLVAQGRAEKVDEMDLYLPREPRDG